MRVLAFLLYLAFGTKLFAQGPFDYKIVTFDKVMIGTDKMIFIEPPVGTYWEILQGSTFIDHVPAEPGTQFNVWLENAPYWSYRDENGEMRGCRTGCVTLQQDNADHIFFPIHGTVPGAIIVSWPNRLCIAFSPRHGNLGNGGTGFETPLQTWTSLAVVEHSFMHSLK